MPPDASTHAPPADWAGSSHFQRVSTAMAVHALEAQAPQDDVAAVHHAMQASTDGHERVLLRAWQLAPAWRLDAAWHRLRQLGWALWGGVVLAILLAAWGMGAAVMGEGARINLLGALLSLLGLNLLMLVLWAVSLFQTPKVGAGAPLVQGAWWHSTVQWLARRMGEPTHRLLMGAFAVLGQARGMAWLSGLISHSAWALGFVLILLLMGWGFAFRAYQPVLETTILSPATVQAMLDVLGWLPHMLGLARPGLDGQTHAATAGTTGQWAWWLMACVLGYGLLPRVLLAWLSRAVLRRKLAAVRLPEGDAGFQRALARLQQLAITRVVDEDQSLAPPVVAVAKAQASSWAALLHELPKASPDGLVRWWQAQPAAHLADVTGSVPAAVPLAVWQQAPRWQGASDGSAASVRACVAALAPADGVPAGADSGPALLMAVGGVASPDRSVARFMRALLAHAHSVHVVLWQDAHTTPEARAAGRARWQAWLQAEQLPVALMEKDWT